MNPALVRNPKWANPEHTAINLEVTWKSGGQEMPFTASPTDPEAHGRELFNRAVGGEFGEVAEYDGPIFDGPSDIPPAPPVIARITPLEFIDRFTYDEQIAIVTATLQNPAVKLWYDKLLAASFVSFDDPRLSAGLDVLVQAGLLTAERRAEIIPEVIQVSEV